MKALKIIGIIILILIVVPLLISLFLPNKVHVERSRVIDSDKGYLFEQVNTLKNWEKWSPWHRIDPNMGLTYNNIPSGKGASYSWTSKNGRVGNGKLTILESYPNDSIKVEMDFMENGKGWADYYFKKQDNGIEVTWTMDSNLGNPIAKLFGLFMDKMIGPDFEKGLKQLDSIAAGKGPVTENQLKIEQATVKPVKALGIKSSVPESDISKTLGDSYTEIILFMTRNNMKQAGPPFAIYHSHSKEKVDFEACIPVEKISTKPTGRIIETGINEGNAVVAEYYGDYEKSAIGHIAIDKYVATNHKKVKGSPWEEYVTDPGLVRDTAKWLTKIYYPVE
jgi:effector-binding domain-containing protein